jgi:hypothetical protein
MEVENAIDTLVKDLKDCNIWDKLKCLYPLVGTKPNATIFNLKDIPKYKRIRKIESLRNSWK